MANNPSDIPLSIDQICELPHVDRKPFVERILIEYPLFKDIHSQIRRAHEESKYSAEPKCILVVGPSGAGKTTLIETYALNYPPELKDTIIERKSVIATFTQPPRIKNAATCILRAFHDPRATKGEKTDMEDRIRKAVNVCQTEIFFGDEIQEMWNKDAHKIMHEVTNWLKYMIKDLKVACVLTGLEGEAEEVIESNAQLRRLFGRPRRLKPFEWDENNPEKTKAQFIRFLYEVEKKLPFRPQKYTTLASENIAWRCYAASRGRVGYLMKIVRGAAHIALDDKSDSLTIDHLSRSFEENSPLNIDNPFEGNAPSYPLPPLLSDSEFKANHSRRKSK